ncbi:MAG: glycoside hydrolase family 3 C-terminal domain-containing protein [Acidobacteria bacterium]|nr:glycoside hydrolase family 3 C-terminal domain-containing protein [Acidobacteriota bacterium]
MKTFIISALVAAALGTVGVIAQGGGQTPAAKGKSTVAVPPGVPSKVDALVAAMTLEEKIGMLYGTADPAGYGQAGYLAGVPRLKIPPLRLTDGPAGIRTAQPATALPAPVAMASTFSVDLAKQFGTILGRDARARHQNVVLAPMVNIVRVPQAGRNFETLGEDPFLASRLVAAETRGIQGEGVIATIKHYAFNNQENQRGTVSADVDERTGREIYLPGFESSVKAGAGSVMASYNKINGTYAAEHPQLLTDVLRKDWGFKGFVMSDWGATHSAAPALKAGMEMEMPNGRNYGTLADAMKKGELSESVVNEAVKRILSAMDEVGLLAPDTRPVPEIQTTSPAARDIAIAGAVLLKNQGNILPLSKDDVQSLAVIGPTAKVLNIGGGGSSAVRPMRRDNPLEVLQKMAGAGARIAYAKGYDLDGDIVPASALKPAVTLNLVGANTLPAGSTFTWTGTLTAPKTGDYILKVQSAGGRVSMALGAQVAAQQTAQGGRGAGPGGGGAALLQTADGLSNSSTAIHLEAGVPTPISITAGGSGRGGPAPVQMRLAWVTPDIERARIEEAVAAAKAARVAVVFVYDEGTEGRDRASLALPGIQDKLVAAVAAANPRTVVVMNNGAPVLMPWADQVAAILQMWYPGQEGAEATAALLLGEAAPGGRLPVTFPKRAEDAPTANPERYPGVNLKGAYSEGIFIGYRWYDQEKIEPLFPFGFGLSYTTFAYTNVAVKRADDGYDVTFTVKNTGTREGVDVPQVYIGPPANPPVPMAVKALVGFDRVMLAPGASRPVKVHIDSRAMSYWSTKDHAWMVAAGRRTIMVGASSRDIRLNADVTVTSNRREFR